MNRADTVDKYYTVFKVQVDTIEVHGRNHGYHGALVREHLDAYMLKKGYATPKR